MSKPHQTQTLAAFGRNLRWGAQAGVAKGCPMQQALHQCWKACGEGPSTWGLHHPDVWAVWNRGWVPHMGNKASSLAEWFGKAKNHINLSMWHCWNSCYLCTLEHSSVLTPFVQSRNCGKLAGGVHASLGGIHGVLKLGTGSQCVRLWAHSSNHSFQAIILFLNLFEVDLAIAFRAKE